MLINADKQVWVGARIDNTDDAWQMPQGGIDQGEEPWATALRELEEETGIAPHLVERLSECPERLRYDLPEELRGKLWGGKWVGQDQDWFLARFLGQDSDIDIDVAKGVVTLNGTVKTDAARARALALAKATEGVTSVKDSLRVAK